MQEAEKEIARPPPSRPELSRPSRTASVTLLKRWKDALWLGLAIAGAAHLASSILSPLGGLLSRHYSPFLDAAELMVDDVYPDTYLPLRPAHEPWDISTSYPYTSYLTKTVTEGTWLRIATHPTRSEIVFDMLGDLYCLTLDDPHDGLSLGSAKSPKAAIPILTGMPYEKEAEFSPDGSHIVFISDAGFGVDNIWTLPYTTCDHMSQQPQEIIRKSAVQQTNSTFRFFSSPAFHPKKAKIIATKWFLTGRPNGAGEIWEFPFLKYPDPDPTQRRLPERGGRRLIERKLPASWPTERYEESQLGAEQARYSPSGDSVIFTRNVRDDLTGKFSYNKDVHAGINAVFSLDLETGQIETLVDAAPSEPNRPASPGGASMPRLSRDGGTLAFVRRVDDVEVLALRDMRSGTIHYVWSGLSYDLSTIPAFMGAYPNYGWEAGDDAIVIWAQGQIYRISLRLDHLGERVADHRGPELVPFTTDISLALGPTRYSETDIRPMELAEQGVVRSFRNLRSDFLGERVVFEAAGDNFVAQITDGSSDTPVSVPKLDWDLSVSCYAPSFVGQSELVLQACWSDVNFTTFHLADVQRNWSTMVQGVPRGRYISPMADGTHVAFVRTGKDYMFGDIEESFGEGVWVGEMSVPASLQPDSVIHVHNLRRLAGVVSSSDTKLDLVDSQSLLISNGGEITECNIIHGTCEARYRSKTGVEMTVTAGMKSKAFLRAVAFRDFQHVWLSSAVVPQHRMDIQSKPGSPGKPPDLVRLSSSLGGHDVTFSLDGRIVFWLMGPELFRADIAKVLSTCHKATAMSRDTGECAQSHISTRRLNVTFQTALGYQTKSSGGKASLAIVNATLIGMASEDPDKAVLPNAAILVKGGQIVAVGPMSHVKLPDDADVVDAQGGAVLPGYVDVHGHWGGFLSPYPLQSWEMETFLGYGVTTIHNPASRNVAGHMERLLIQKGRMYGPRVFHTGDVLYGSTQPSVYTEINSRAGARAALQRIKTEGGDASFSIKNYQLPARSARQRVLLEAAELGMLVVPEGGWSLDWGLTYFIDGFTTQEHPLPVGELYDDVLSLVAASGSSYTPLAVMNYGGIFGQHFIHQSVHVPGDAKLRSYVRHDILESLTEVKQAPSSSYLFLNMTKSTAELARRGVRTNVGAHGEQPIGFLFHAEMLMMALGGQTPYQVLRHATIGGATSLGLNSSIGSAEVGKLADLTIYPPGVNTVESVWNSSMHMRYVLKGGTLFAVENGLVEMWPRKGRKQMRARLNAEDEL